MLGFIAIMFFIGLVRAEYIDPIDIPATKSEISHQALHLDIATSKNRIISVGEHGIILFSDDQGETWAQASVPSSAQLNAIHIHNSTHGWAVGEDKVILKTIDSGTTWVHKYDARDADLKGPLLDVWFKDNKEGFAVGVYNTLLHTNDGGETWKNAQSNIDNEDEWHLFAIAANLNGGIYISSETGLVFRSQDQGNTFIPIETGHEGSFHGVLTQPSLNNRENVLVFGVGGTLMFSSDNGDQWESINTGTRSGLSGGIWLNPQTALITVADGSFITFDVESKRVGLFPSEVGLPLNSITRIDQDNFAAVGLGGIQIIPTNKISVRGP